MIAENPVKKTLQSGGSVIGCQVCEIRSPNICQMYATAGFDFIFIDMLHGALGMETVSDMISASTGAGIVPLVRVPDEHPHTLGRLLDQGAGGLIIPEVRTAAQAEAAVRAAKYAPAGHRGMAPNRSHTRFGKMEMNSLIATANENVLIAIMVESVEGVENADTIAAVEGVDVIFMGTMDLSCDLGVPGQVRHPEILKRIDRVIEICDTRGVAFGMPIPDPAWLQPGIRFLYSAGDVNLIVEGGARIVESFRGAIGLSGGGGVG